MMPDSELKAMAKDIGTNGLRRPIVRDGGGVVLDGRNRMSACQIAGVEPTYQTVDLDEEGKRALIVSLNIMRRHLTPSQRSVVAAQLVTTKTGDNQHSEGAQNCASISQKQAADLLNVSRTSVQTAQKLVDRAPKELVQQVTDGKMSVSAANKVVEGVSVAQKRERSASTAKKNANPEAMRKIEKLFNGLSSKAKTQVVRTLLADDVVKASRDRESKQNQRSGQRAIDHASELLHTAEYAFDGFNTQYASDAGWLAHARRSEADSKIVDGMLRVLTLLPARVAQVKSFIEEKR